MKNLFIIIFALILFYSCSNDVTTINLRNINDVRIPANPSAYKMSIKITGVVYCSAELTILSNGKRTNRIFHLNEKIKVNHKSDWYEQEMGFLLEPVDCIGDDATIKITIYD